MQAVHKLGRYSEVSKSRGRTAGDARNTIQNKNTKATAVPREIMLAVVLPSLCCLSMSKLWVSRQRMLVHDEAMGR